MRSLLRILVLLTFLLLLGLGGSVGWNAWRIQQIQKAWKKVGVLPARDLDLASVVPAGEEVQAGSYRVRLPWAKVSASANGSQAEVQDGETQKMLAIRPIEPGGPGIEEILEVLRFDPEGLSPLCSPAEITRTVELVRKRLGEIGGAQVSVFDYRGFRGLKSECGHDVHVHVFGPQGRELLMLFQHPESDPILFTPAEVDGTLRSLIDSMTEEPAG